MDEKSPSDDEFGNAISSATAPPHCFWRTNWDAKSQIFAEALARGSVFMGLPFKWTSSLEMSQSPHVSWRRSDPDLDLNFEAHLFYLSISKS